jgi:poly(hydroxyalkanoate) granule-associated protein
MPRTQRTTKAPLRTFPTLAKRARNFVEKAGAIAIARVSSAREVALDRAGAARNSTVRAVGQLERVFEQRVTKVVRKLGVPSHSEVRALSRQVAELQASVERLRRSRARA